MPLAWIRAAPAARAKHTTAAPTTFSLNMTFSSNGGIPAPRGNIPARGQGRLSGILPARRAVVPREQGIECERTRSLNGKRDQGGQVQQIRLVAWRSELGARGGYGAQLDRTESVRQVHGDRGDEQNDGERHAHQWDPRAD